MQTVVVKDILHVFKMSFYLHFTYLFANLMNVLCVCTWTLEDAGTETERGRAAEAVSDRAAVDPKAAVNHCSSECQSYPGQSEGQSVQATLCPIV